jgi:hypothetical protein
MEVQTPHTATHDAMAGWWSSRYGAGDEAGALNEITPVKVLEAVRLVRQGRVYDLAHVLDQDIPAFPGRTFRQYLTANYHHTAPSWTRSVTDSWCRCSSSAAGSGST